MAEAGRSARDVEQALAVLDTYHRQIDALSRQVQFLQALHMETRRARDALAGLRDEKSDEVLLPLGANTFIYAKAARRDKVLSGIGAGLSLERPWEDAEKGLESREAEIQGEVERLSDAAIRLQQEAAELEAQIQQSLPQSGA